MTVTYSKVSAKANCYGTRIRQRLGRERTGANETAKPEDRIGFFFNTKASNLAVEKQIDLFGRLGLCSGS
jgi:hypothetical protein